MVVLALPGFFTLPPLDRDEVLFSQASRQMLASGDFVDIRFADGPRYKKPVGIYWLQAAVTAVTGHTDQIWAYRLVSLLAAVAAVGLTHGIARLYLKPEAAFLAAVALAASLMLGAEAHLAKTDATLLATIAAGQYVLARGIRDGRLSFAMAMGFWVALAASVLVKGPIGPMVIAFTLAGHGLIRRDLSLLRSLRPLPGLALLIVLAAPWFVAISYLSHGAFWSASLGRDMFEKLASGKENHGAPPGSYLAAVWLTFWPGAMPLLAAIPAVWRGRRDELVSFALVWLAPTWVVFELTATKLVHYTLPTYPALALLLG
jgi:4-amino-4-deoxy-L-arabinose transferase-like glycosyltransferase